MWSGFQAKNVNTYGEFELDHAQNQAEPENQAGLVPGPDPDQKKNVEIIFKKSNPQLCPFSTWKDSLLCQHMSEKSGVSKL